jgi:hypothetical protein
MARQEGKADQKQKQIRDENPFVLEMGKETREASAFVEAGAQELLEDDDAKAGDGGGKGMAMKNCDAGKRGGEKQKIDQHGEIVSAKLRSDANGHVQGPAGFVVDFKRRG